MFSNSINEGFKDLKVLKLLMSMGKGKTGISAMA